MKTRTSSSSSSSNCTNGSLFAVISVFLLAAPTFVTPFNFENRLPILKQGQAGSYFGYSIAEHVELVKDRSGRVTDERKWLLVGAPLGENLQPRTNRSGALFKCPLTQNRRDCEQVITDGYRLDENTGGPSKILDPPYDDEIKDGQWMGVTVRSQGKGNVLVCAHRHIKKSGESRWGQGMCYLLKNNLGFEQNFEPCTGRPTERAHEDYGFCQAGTSGAMLEDGTMIVGAPGPYTWRGTMFLTATGGNYLSRDKTQYYTPHMDLNSPVDKYSYLGMGVTGGKYYGNYYSFAAGAPRSEGFGQVVIFSKNNNANPMLVTQVINGTQFGANFGYELASADINGDGKTDLIVAAPFYFEKNNGGAVYVYQNKDFSLPQDPTLTLTGKFESRFGLALANLGDINQDGCEDLAIGAPYEERGVVYIYLGSKNGLLKEPSQIVTAASLGLNTPTTLKTFGSSLSGGVDLDNNMYPDLLIGAFNSDVVVALLARPITNIKTEIEDSQLKNIAPDKIGCQSDPSSNLTCFSFTACCSFERVQSQQELELIYNIEAETFNGMKKFSRVFFAPYLESKNNSIRKSIKILPNGRQNCQTETVYLKENTRDIQTPIKFRLSYKIVEPPLPDSALTRLHPILDKTQADRTFVATFAKDCGSNDICETQLELQATLVDMEKTENPSEYDLILGKRNEIHLKATVTNDQDSAYEAQLFILHPKTITYIATSKSTVVCNSFNETCIACTLGNPMKRDTTASVVVRFEPSGLDDSTTNLDFQLFVNSTSKQIKPRPDLFLTAKIVKKAEVSIVGTARPEQAFYGSEAKRERDEMESINDIGTAVEHIYEVYNDGPWRATFMEVFIDWPHQVPTGKDLLYPEELPIIEGGGGGTCSIVGDGVVNPLKLERRPTKVMSQLVEEPIPESLRQRTGALRNKTLMETSSRYQEKSSSVHVKEETSSSSALNRVRRYTEDVIKAEKLVDSNGNSKYVVTMDCQKSTAKCIRFKCVIFNLQPKKDAFIRMRARLWNATLTTDYPKIDSVRVVSHAEIVIPEIYKIHQDISNDRTTAETIAYPDLPGEDEGVPFWIYILAILLGLLLLALMALCLWKCGFFKRRRPDPMVSGNLEKSSETKPFIS
ncbi:integrin alpha-PS1 [Culicoides brevitarsis]|uniref:integrin alpha-PS1 n=1 Tax=Culicoides brevitarsis TaxID=469753 RepID=UPI00307C7967